MLKIFDYETYLISYIPCIMFNNMVLINKLLCTTLLTLNRVLIFTVLKIWF